MDLDQLTKEEIYRRIATAVPEGIWIVNPQGRTIFCNQRMAEILGTDVESLRALSCFDPLFPDDVEEAQRRFASQIAGDRAAFDFRLRGIDGSAVWVSISCTPMYDESGLCNGLLGLFTDIGERKRTEAALRQSEERFRRVFEDGPMGLALVAKDHHFVKVNNALCQMVGYSEEELLQKSFVEITHPDDVQSDVDLASRLFGREIPFFKMQKRYVKKNQEVIWVNLTASLVHDHCGEPLHGLAMVEDITETKRGQEEALARQKLESIGVLAGGIAHDFNNLLGSILASAELGMTEIVEGSALDGILQRIKIASVRGAEIVRELLLYSGNESPMFEPFDLSGMIREILQLFQISISKQALLQMDLAQDLPLVYASPTQIRQVAMNLILNASDAIGQQSGTIRVATAKVRVGDSDFVGLEVSDTGSGMTPELQARIFDPFFSTKHAGRGLGLAAVQGIIRNHGGILNVSSAPGRGSRFEILLPCIDLAAPKAREVPAVLSARDAGATAGPVLFIEDEEILRIGVSTMLRRAGFSVIEAGDGVTGLSLFQAGQGTIDVVLLDVTLPCISGWEVLRELRRMQPDLKIILTTAFTEENAVPPVGEPPWGYIRKPYPISELASLLRKALDKTKSSGKAAG